MPTQLTRNFSLEEMTSSETATRQGWSNDPPTSARYNLQKLAETLEVARLIIGAPLVIHSAYRSTRLNAAVGGSPTSDHVTGRAADFVPRSTLGLIPCYRLLVKALAKQQIALDQLIAYPERGHLHIGIGSKMRRQCWIHGS